VCRNVVMDLQQRDRNFDRAAKSRDMALSKPNLEFLECELPVDFSSTSPQVDIGVRTGIPGVPEVDFIGIWRLF
jgi:hypothetical protein